jgi:hypothetical protein
MGSCPPERQAMAPWMAADPPDGPGDDVTDRQVGQFTTSFACRFLSI